MWVCGESGSAYGEIYPDPFGPDPRYRLTSRVSPIALSGLYNTQNPAAQNRA